VRACHLHCGAALRSQNELTDLLSHPCQLDDPRRVPRGTSVRTASDVRVEQGRLPRSRRGGQERLRCLVVFDLDGGSEGLR
jgi:hypothetical protein